MTFRTVGDGATPRRNPIAPLALACSFAVAPSVSVAAPPDAPGPNDTDGDPVADRRPDSMCGLRVQLEVRGTDARGRTLRSASLRDMWDVEQVVMLGAGTAGTLYCALASDDKGRTQFLDRRRSLVAAFCFRANPMDGYSENRFGAVLVWTEYGWWDVVAFGCVSEEGHASEEGVLRSKAERHGWHASKVPADLDGWHATRWTSVDGTDIVLTCRGTEDVAPI